MKTMEKKQFNFGVQDYNKTFDNHSVKLRKYREACEETPGLRYDFTRDPYSAYKRELDAKQWAGVILAGVGFVHGCNMKSFKARVNSYFYSQIVNYLHCADLPISWATAVYLDCYDELNEFMNEVANCIWEEIH